LQFGVDPASRLELEAAGAGPGDGRTFDAVARQQVASAPGPIDRLGHRLAPLVPAAQVLGRAVIGLQPGKGEVRCAGDMPGEIERPHLADIVGANADMGALCQRRQPLRLRRRCSVGDVNECGPRRDRYSKRVAVAVAQTVLIN